MVLAAELARLREKSGKSLSDLAADTTYDRTYLHKLETGVKLGSPDVMEALDKAHDTGEHLVDLWELARNDVFRDKYKRFMELEQQATVRYEYAVGAVPGLLQTERYARAVLALSFPGEEQGLEEQVAARMGRQKLLHGEDVPHFRAVLDESVLRRPMRDKVAWTQQLGHLLTVADQPRVTLQVLPFSAGLHHLMGTSLTILWLPDGKSAAYTETNVNGELFEDPTEVERLKLSYDLLRDFALSPQKSVEVIQETMEDNPS
ncbi:helix-turn-helix domain-containing protein [Streptomyces sp. NPDC087844]|uniref:helix-turn-helix domain-containing protein n=1 Tax=Streptomyces sp. NPDC087844 TaxID=3365805 RepID=UPI0038182572